jgi:transitional endoplasmic reticulum ATPase
MKEGVRESIEAKARFEAAQELNVGEEVQMDYDPVPELTRKHFEIAMQTARKSVKPEDLIKYENFKKSFDP